LFACLCHFVSSTFFIGVVQRIEYLLSELGLLELARVGLVEEGACTFTNFPVIQLAIRVLEEHNSLNKFQIKLHWVAIVCPLNSHVLIFGNEAQVPLEFVLFKFSGPLNNGFAHGVESLLLDLWVVFLVILELFLPALV